MDFRRRRVPWTWSYIKERRDTRRAYIACYKSVVLAGGQALAPLQDVSTLEELEAQLNIFDIVLYRKIAVAALASDTRSTTASSSSSSSYFALGKWSFFGLFKQDNRAQQEQESLGRLLAQLSAAHAAEGGEAINTVLGSCSLTVDRISLCVSDDCVPVADDKDDMSRSIRKSTLKSRSMEETAAAAAATEACQAGYSDGHGNQMPTLSSFHFASPSGRSVTFETTSISAKVLHPSVDKVSFELEASRVAVLGQQSSSDDSSAHGSVTFSLQLSDAAPHVSFSLATHPLDIHLTVPQLQMLRTAASALYLSDVPVAAMVYSRHALRLALASKKVRFY